MILPRRRCSKTTLLVWFIEKVPGKVAEGLLRVTVSSLHNLQ